MPKIKKKPCFGFISHISIIPSFILNNFWKIAQNDQCNKFSAQYSTQLILNIVYKNHIGEKTKFWPYMYINLAWLFVYKWSIAHDREIIISLHMVNNRNTIDLPNSFQTTHSANNFIQIPAICQTTFWTFNLSSIVQYYLLVFAEQKYL